MGASEPPAVIARIDLAEEPEFELGGVIVRPAELAVESGRNRSELQPRVMQVLIALAKTRPAVVSRDRLIEQCWGGRVVGDDAVNRVILSLRHLAQEFTPEPFVIETVPRIGHRLVETDQGRKTRRADPDRTHRAGRWLWAAAALLLGVVGLAVLLHLTGRLPWQRDALLPTVLVVPAADDAASAALARDLAVDIARLPGQTEPMRLIGAANASPTTGDLVLTVGYQPAAGALAGRAVLNTGKKAHMLWSQDFSEPSRDTGILRQQVAYTAAHVLRCTLEGMASEDRLGDELLKTYVRGCAEELDPRSRDYRPVVQGLESIVQSAPRFKGGWAKLLNAQMYAVQDFLYPDGSARIPSLKRHVAAARRYYPGLPEADLAEYILIPTANFVERGGLLDEVVRRNPDHATTRAFRAAFLASVGRMEDSVRDAREAARLDPLLPEFRDAYVGALAGAGQMNAALAEAATTERLWPGASSAVGAKYRVHLRWGDPREALRLIEHSAVDSPAIMFQRAFLEARISRSPVAIENAIRQGRSAFEDHPEAFDHYAQALAEFDRKDELLGIMLNYPRPHALAWSAEPLFRPAFSEVHRDPRFMKAAQRMGMLEYWRTTGKWPDFCFAADLPYDCQKEAARIGT